MNLRPAWLKDLCSILFTGYYLVWATEADEKLRRFRALPTVEMLRVTWEKTNNPYVSRELELRGGLRRNPPRINVNPSVFCTSDPSSNIF
jgi:hypothetical protein